MPDGAAWSVLVRGFGLVKGPGVTRNISVDVLAARFVAELVSAGQDVSSADLILGKSEDLLAAARQVPRMCAGTSHVLLADAATCLCQKLKVRKPK